MKRIIEPDLKYCPICDEEYRADIVTCADCNVELLTGTRMLELERQKQERKAARTMQLSPDDEMVTIRKGPVLQMKELQILLQGESIPSLTIKEDSGGCGKGCCGTDLMLQVRMTDVQEVLAILEQEHIRSTALEEHDTTYAGAVFNTAAEKATCPACGCSFPTTESICPDCGLCFA